MSYAIRVVLPAFALLGALSLTSCAASTGDAAAETTTSELAVGTDATITFTASWQTQTSAPLTAGYKATVRYDASRLIACRGDMYGGPAWTITGHYRLNGGPVGSFEAGGHSPSGGTAKPEIPLTAPGDLAIWFENDSIWGCQAYDSNYGNNYHFTVAPSPNAPGWVGNAMYVLSRGTCNGGPCAQDLQPLSGGFTYDTWTRQRAAIRRVQFEVWKRGVTDYDNPNLWRELDVEVHTRIGAAGTFDTRYVTFDARAGNNARYALDLRTLDPFGAVGTITDKAACPTFPVTYEGPVGNDYIDADVEFYFTVNGTELRPTGGGVFHGKYQDYAGPYAICR